MSEPENRPKTKDNVPWPKAVELCGGEDRLRRGVKGNRLANWKARGGVPALHVLKIYEQRVLEAGGRPPSRDDFSAYPPHVSEMLHELVNYVANVGEDIVHHTHFWIALRVALEHLNVQLAKRQLAEEGVIQPPAQRTRRRAV